MTKLLKNFYALEKQYSESAKTFAEKGDFKQVKKLDAERHAAQEKLLLQMSNAEITHIINRHDGISQGKAYYEKFLRFDDTHAETVAVSIA